MAVVRVIYKSGACVDVEVEKFTAERRGGELSRVTWERARPRPLYFGVNEVAAIYELVPAEPEP